MNNSTKNWERPHEAIPEETKAILNEYLLGLHQRDWLESIISINQDVLEQFLSECSVPIQELTSLEVFEWLQQYLDRTNLQKTSLSLTILISFLHFCLKQGYMQANSMEKRQHSKTLPRKHEILERKEGDRLLAATETFTLSDHALIHLLISTGCRLSEVSKLRVQDVNLENLRLFIRERGNRARYVHISEDSAKLLRDFIHARSGKETDLLFPNEYGKTDIYIKLRTAAKESGLEYHSPNINQRLYTEKKWIPFPTTSINNSWHCFKS